MAKCKALTGSAVKGLIVHTEILRTMEIAQCASSGLTASLVISHRSGLTGCRGAGARLCRQLAEFKLMRTCSICYKSGFPNTAFEKPQSSSPSSFVDSATSYEKTNAQRLGKTKPRFRWIQK